MTEQEIIDIIYHIGPLTYDEYANMTNIDNEAIENEIHNSFDD